MTIATGNQILASDFNQVQRSLASGTLASPATSLTVSSIPARNFLKVYIYTPSFAVADTCKLRFNADTGANYGWTYTTDGGASSDGNAVTSIDIIPIVATDGFWATFDIYNITATAKKGTGISIKNSSGTDTNSISTIGFSWNNTAAQISSITLLSTLGNNFATGTTMYVFGADA
jgi:hypothetical protein